MCIFLLQIGSNISHKNMNAMFCTRAHFQNSLSLYEPNNKWSRNPYMRSWLHMLSHTLITKLQITNFSHSPCKSNTWKSITCFTSMYKNMYNPKRKISLLILSIIITMLAKTQGENKWKQEDKKCKEVKPRITREWSKLNSLQNFPFWAYIENQHFHFLAHGYSSLSTFDLYLINDPKAL